MPVLLLVRHGETEWNRERRWQGQFDMPLTPVGVAQSLVELVAHQRPGEVELLLGPLALQPVGAQVVAVGTDLRPDRRC